MATSRTIPSCMNLVWQYPGLLCTPEHVGQKLKKQAKVTETRVNKGELVQDLSVFRSIRSVIFKERFNYNISEDTLHSPGK